VKHPASAASALRPIAWALLLAICTGPWSASASHHYTDKQLDVLAERVGKIYWINDQESGAIRFLSSPDVKARSFEPLAFESFEILELVGRKNRNPFYKVKTASGKMGFIRPEEFLEQLNLAILSVDPKADEKQRAAEAEAEEKKRLGWIEKQPWSQAVKDAAIRGQAVPGMTAAETKRVRGEPTRTARLRSSGRSSQEHWFYPNGDVLIFQNGLLQELRKRDSDGP
jgi:hypothetical protein